LDGKETIWGDINGGGGSDEVDMDEMKSLFVAAVPSPTSSGRRKRRLNQGDTGDGGKGGKGKGKVTLVDGKRSRNVAISLARIKMSYEQIKDGLFNVSLPGMTTEQLLVLESVLPSPTEMRLVRGYRGDVARLETTERFFHTVMQVENINERLGCMLCVRQFPEHVKQLLDRIHVVTTTVADIKKSTLLKRVLEIALKIGNQLNQLEEGKGGGVRAFSLRSLVKLSQTKSFDQKTTVLHVIAKYALKKKEDSAGEEHNGEEHNGEENNGEGGETKQTSSNELEDRCINMMEEIPLLETATKLPLKTLELENKNLRRSLQLVLKQLKNAPIMDPVWGPIRQFAATAHVQMEVVARLLSTGTAQYKALVDFFAEEIDLTNEEFFKMLCTFSKSFVQACADNKRAEDAEKRKLRLEQEQLDKAAKRGRRSSMKQQTPPGEPGEPGTVGTAVVGGKAVVKVEGLTPSTEMKKKKKKRTSPVRNEFGRKITPREAMMLAIAKKGKKK